MDSTKPGLRYRAKRAIRQMGEQHAYLRSIFAEIRRAIEQADAQRTREALGRLQEALEAHFRLEDRVFFPALNGLRSGHTEGLEMLSREHVGFADALRRLGMHLESSDLAGFGRDFDAFAGSLSAHEEHEERLVADVVGGSD
jgi:hypothetical protein